jgi:type I restriction enzyme R subunit
MSLNESIVEEAALEWFGELGYAVGHGPHLAPGEPAAERDSFSEVVLAGRLREAIRRPADAGPPIPEEASTCALHADRRATDKESLSVQIERRLNP